MADKTKAEEILKNKGITPLTKHHSYDYLYCSVVDAMEEYRQSEIDELNKEVERLRKEREWISVEDRLPFKDGNDSIMCLVRTTFKETLCRPYNEYHKCWDDEDYDDHFTPAIGGKVTHWQPLPKFNI